MLCPCKGSERAIEIGQTLEGTIPFRNDRRRALPVKPEAVVADPGILLFAILGGDEVVGHSVVGKRFEAMGEAFGYIIGLMVGGGKLGGIMLPVGSACLPQVYDHIQDAAGRAAYDLGMLMRRQLEVHAPDNIFLGKGKIALFKPETDLLLLEKAFLECFDEKPAIIFEGRQGDQVSAGKRQRIEMKHCCNV